ncbi:MAG TPA: isoprenylcysteine carboxyl methyltransferase [Candidatus Paceibacterota bacterium]
MPDTHTHTRTATLPPSVVGWFDALFALPLVVGLFFLLRLSPLSDVGLGIALVIALALVMGIIELRRAPWRALARTAQPFFEVVERATVKLLGFFAALCAIAFAYWLFPEYDRAYYDRFFEAARLVLPWLPFITIPYFFYVEWRLPREHGGAWEAAMLVLGKWKGIRWDELSQYALGWLVKGFFLPIMFTDIVNNLGLLRAAEWNFLASGFLPSFQLTFSSLIYLELVFVSAGYIFTCRLFDTHIRAVEKTLFGWAIALMSYSPFLGLFYIRYLDYSVSGGGWIEWLSAYPAALYTWGGLIIVLLVVHLWSDACFGLRFSNLTHRGIITNGPFRFSKHPAYFIKNLRWWMVSVPFFAISPPEAVRLCLLLLLVNCVYTLRGYAEERMLSRDPTYVAYARWIEAHGLLRFLGRYVPAFSYEWRLARWRKQGYVPEEGSNENTIAQNGNLVPGDAVMYVR